MKQFFNYLYYKTYSFYRLSELSKRLQALQIVLSFKVLLGFNIVLLLNHLFYKEIGVENGYLFAIIGGLIIISEFKANKERYIPRLENLYKHYTKRTNTIDSAILSSLFVLLFLIPIIIVLF